jgi:hypothetical protein
MSIFIFDRELSHVVVPPTDGGGSASANPAESEVHNTTLFYRHEHNSSIFHSGYSFLLQQIVRSLSFSSVRSLLITSFRDILAFFSHTHSTYLSLRDLCCPVNHLPRYRPFRYTIPYYSYLPTSPVVLLDFLWFCPFRCSLFAIHVPFPLSDCVYPTLLLVRATISFLYICIIMSDT